MTEVNRGNRLMLLLIAGVPVLVILAATWLWYFVARGDLDLVSFLGTANRGTLVQPPRSLLDATQGQANTIDFTVDPDQPRWSMLIPNSGTRCVGACESRLYLTRQIHLAMGKQSHRLRRLYVGDEPLGATELQLAELSDGRPIPAGFAAFLHGEHPGLSATTASRPDFSRLFPEYRRSPDTWYLVDPAGWIMMSYDTKTSYQDIIADLKFLLKNSNE